MITNNSQGDQHTMDPKAKVAETLEPLSLDESSLDVPGICVTMFLREWEEKLRSSDHFRGGGGSATTPDQEPAEKG